MTWTQRELEILEATARVGSVFSLLGASFIIITFCTSRSFHRPINRLAFFAAFGNIMTNVATLMAQDPRPGSALCKMQAMFIQWFLPADALFCSAMAMNVYLTVFKKYPSSRLQQLEIPYIIICYGVPLIPAFVFLFIETESKGPLYGNAVLWCWISADWQYLRIAAFYGPVWVVLLFTFSVYLMAGRVIFSLRGSLRMFAKDQASGSETAVSRSRYRDSTVVKPGAVGTNHSIQMQTQTVCETNTIIGQAVPAIGPTYSVAIEGGSDARWRQRSAIEANTAAWAYCRCALLFFLALLITWLPSSVNRIYTLFQPYSTHFGLNFAAVLVLPCQGFWNGLIYIVTTLPACKEFFLNIGNGIRNPRLIQAKLKRRFSISSRERKDGDSEEDLSLPTDVSDLR
ncbi:hypothetical protein BJ508DRAFT_207609 [Ascobolus immersus RN42]|uniref:G-protein coupled receptors family 2 profile 2 domain-containing protein n=1 Tax=Ascobolus immersus RN42 TaxID=1160509 RepID=A0A3N4IN95_ASCIM|nr:hypothetical protein BJ508DRAFT_207609 [Ascobolus immersus RN42]